METVLTKRQFFATGAALIVFAASGRADEAQTPVTYPIADVQQIMTLKGEFVRMAYNGEGYAVVGYRMAQQEAGNQWVLLSFGVTLREKVKDQTMKREDLTIKMDVLANGQATDSTSFTIQVVN